MRTLTETSTLEVVVVDASKFQLSLTRTMLSQIGVRRMRAYDRPDDAFSHMVAEPGGLVLLDADILPCLRLIDGLRDPANAPLCFTPVIVTATAITRAFVKAAIRHGANFVIARPYSPTTLKLRIEHVVAGRDRLVMKDGRYAAAGIVEAMQARAVRSDTSRPASFRRDGSDQPQAGKAIDTLWLDDDVTIRNTHGAPPPQTVSA